jgi:polyisoprenoid-binding protein YceI
MKKIILSIFLAAAAMTQLSAQKYFTKDGSIRFSSSTKAENIEANNNKATFVVDAATGQVEISVLITGFVFKQALMQEHFNENYMESEKFPKATFKGKIENLADVKFTSDGSYKIKVTGDMTMHGVTKQITVDATLNVRGGKIAVDSKFGINPKDYNIAIPDLVKDNIASNIDISLKGDLQELKK